MKREFSLRGRILCALALLMVVASGAVMTPGLGTISQAQRRTDPGAAELRHLTADPLYVLEDSYLKWPLPPALAFYGRIDGARLKQYVNELAAISQKSRDDGNPVWGRVVGTPYDRQTQQWLTGKFRSLGLQPRSEELALEPVWRATSWEMSVSSEDKSLRLSTARPVLQAVATPPQGVELEAAWGGLGTEADFRDRDVRRKAVFIYSIPQPGTLHYSARSNGAIERAEDKGAAAIVLIIGIPGNVTNQLWSRGEHVPMFSLGLQDGEAVRQLMEQAPAGQPPKLRIRLETKMESGLKTASIWAALPGATDENILVMAHFDSWFYGALDNASGVATMLGLAEYFAKVPQGQRRRAMTFVGFSSHEMPDSGYPWAQWMVEKRQDLLSRTALIVNCEHTAATEVYVYGDMLRKANTVTARRVSVGHSKALAPIIAQALSAFGVSTYAELDSAPLGEIQRFFKFAPGFQTIRDPVFYHSDADTPDMVPAAGLEAITRAYAKIIDDTNRLDLKSIVEGVAAPFYSADSPIAGTWAATMHGLPAIKMTVTSSGGKLRGNIIFYMLMLENGAWKVKGDDATEMIKPRMEGETFVFEVPHAKKHGSTNPADQEIKTFRLQLTGPNEAVFKNADNGQDLKLTRLK